MKESACSNQKNDQEVLAKIFSYASNLAASEVPTEFLSDKSLIKISYRALSKTLAMLAKDEESAAIITAINKVLDDADKERI